MSKKFPLPSSVKVSPKTLYTVKNHPGAHIVRAIRERVDENAQTHICAEVLLIGAQLPYTVPLADVRPWASDSPRAQMPAVNRTVALAQEAVLVYGLDPARVQRAALLMYSRGVLPARYNADGTPRETSLDVLAVRVSAGGWYTVERGSCTCPDHRAGHVCKHRIAAWMYREAVTRAEREVAESVIRMDAAKKESILA